MASKNDTVELNVAKMKPGEFINVATSLIASAKNGLDIPAISLIGSPGIAKSASIKAVANNVSKITGKKVFVHDIRLINMNPVDLRGIPSKATIKQKVRKQYHIDGKLEEKVTEEDVDVARWLMPEILKMDPSDDVINILFLDEITSAPPSVQAVAYQITLDRRVGEHYLASNVFVFAASNKSTDRAVSYKMPTALANRMLHIEFYCEIDDWKNWALNKGIDSRIISFLTWKPDMLFKFDPSSDSLAFPTPRTWEMVHNILQKLPDVDVAGPLIAGAVGLGAAQEFIGHTKVFHSLPNVADIFNGKKVEYPKQMDVCYALSASITTYAQKATKKQINNLIIWMTKWQPDYAILTVKDCLRLPRMLDYFSQSAEWVNWYKQNKEFIDM